MTPVGTITDCYTQLEEARATIRLLNTHIMALQQSIDLIATMAANLNDPTASELITDILHPEERTGP